nr:hypothetical protein B11C_190041 [Bartonella sp. 1-1C]
MKISHDNDILSEHLQHWRKKQTACGAITLTMESKDVSLF